MRLRLRGHLSSRIHRIEQNWVLRRYRSKLIEQAGTASRLYTCSVCHFPGMTQRPADWAICPSCGVEFNYDDACTSHAELRRRWIAGGAKWWSNASEEPEEWFPTMSFTPEEVHLFLTAGCGYTEAEIAKLNQRARDIFERKLAEWQAQHQQEHPTQ